MEPLCQPDRQGIPGTTASSLKSLSYWPVTGLPGLKGKAGGMPEKALPATQGRRERTGLCNGCFRPINLLGRTSNFETFETFKSFLMRRIGHRSLFFYIMKKILLHFEMISFYFKEFYERRLSFPFLWV